MLVWRRKLGLQGRNTPPDRHQSSSHRLKPLPYIGNELISFSFYSGQNPNRIPSQTSTMAELLVSSPPPMDETLLLPVVLSEGGERVHVGTLPIHPSVGVGNLHLAISKMIDLPPYQITPFLVGPTLEKVRINEKTDLSVVSCKGGEWHVLAVVRPRTGRNRRSRRTKGGSRAVVEDPKPRPEKIILRRNDARSTPVVYDLMCGPVAMMPMWDRFYQPQILDVQREGSWMDTWCAPEPVLAVCGVCEAAAYLGVEAAFHGCVKDEIVGPFFRSPVGPIERPSGKRVEGCA